MNQYLVRYKMRTYVYMGKSFVSKWKLAFVTADSEELALIKLKDKKEYSEYGSDSASVDSYEFVETI